MKRLYVYLIILALTNMSVYAQKSFILQHQPKNGFITLSSGVSLPTGKFALCLTRDNEAGLARQGMMASLSAGYRVVGPVGLMVRYELFRNRVHEEALLDGLYQMQNDSWAANAGFWAVTSVTAGPYVNIPKGRWTIQARATAGQATAVCPSTSLRGRFMDIPMAIETSEVRSTARSYNGGVTIRYRLGRSTAVQFNTDYSRADFMFEDMKTTTSSGTGQDQTNLVTNLKPIRVVSLSAGFTVLIGNRNRVF